MAKVPGRKVKRELAKGIVQALLGGKVSVEELEEISREIDAAHYTTSDPDVIIQAVVNGACGAKTASIALGFDEDEYLEARKDHAERLKRIAESQGMGDGAGDPAARGLKDLSAMRTPARKKRRSAGTQPCETPRLRAYGQGRFSGS